MRREVKKQSQRMGKSQHGNASASFILSSDVVGIVAPALERHVPVFSEVG